MNILSKLIKKKEGKAEVKPVDNQSSQTSKPFVEGLVSTKDIIAPSALEVDFNHIRVNERYYRTIFVAGYPRFVGINWLSNLINFDASLTTAMYIYPTDGKEILDDLRRKIAEMEAEISTDMQRGRVVNPATSAKLEDALNLQADLVKGEERFFQFGLYVTIGTDSKEEVERITKNLEAGLGALMIISKKATLQMEEGFVTTLPICSDRLQITRNMDTTSLATTFPFVSSDLSDDKGIMYGINEHNGSLVIFDRFSMPNYNSVVFATAGAGKSYLIKLEVLRSLMLGTEIIVIDPENEYKDLCEAVGGQYIAFGYGEASKINPFDLSLVEEEGENALNSKILSLHKLFKIMLGEMDPIEESILDKAIMDAYKMKGITPDPESQKKEPPLIEDLYKSLVGMEEEKSKGLAARLEKYIKGSFAGIFNQKTTVNLNNKFVVFGIRNLEDSLRPVAMHIVLDHIWTVVKKDLKRRIMVVDEAWYLMQYPDSASFLRGIVKRGRKYYLGVTTITQDVDDFLETPFGKEIVTNSAIQILLKQHSAAIEQVGEVFYLSEGEKQLLLAADKGEGIFFAGQNHVALRVIASEEEHKLITSNPEEVMKWKAQKSSLKTEESTVKTKVEIKQAEPTINIVGDQSTKPITGTQAQTNLPTTTSVPPTTVVSPPTGLIPTTKPTLEEPKVLFKAEVVENETEKALGEKIKQMEEEEKKEIEAHQKKVEEEKKKKEEEEKKKLSGTFNGFGGSPMGGLPKYGELFKSSSAGKLPPLPPLPPLPKVPANQNSPLPKFEPPKAMVADPILSKPAIGKPIFVNQPEPKIPQPPQFAKIKNQNSNTRLSDGQVKNEQQGSQTQSDQNKKNLSYEELFGPPAGGGDKGQK